MSANDASVCPARDGMNRSHVPVMPPLAVACAHCGRALSWTGLGRGRAGWWCEDQGNHMYCPALDGPGKHEPAFGAAGTCTMGPGCDCPFHDGEPWPDHAVPPSYQPGFPVLAPPHLECRVRGRHDWPSARPGNPSLRPGQAESCGLCGASRKALKSGMHYRRPPVTDGPVTDGWDFQRETKAPPKAQRSPMDELYAGTTGRTLPPDTYQGWGTEWVDTGNQYAKERMASHVTFAVPAEGFEWDSAVGEVVTAVESPAAVEPPKAAVALPRGGVPAEIRIWFLALLLVCTGTVTGIHVFTAIGMVLWAMQLYRETKKLRLRVRISRNKARSVEGRHAKKSG
jgi:hypothetical protein